MFYNILKKYYPLDKLMSFLYFYLLKYLIKMKKQNEKRR